MSVYDSVLLVLDTVDPMFFGPGYSNEATDITNQITIDETVDGDFIRYVFEERYFRGCISDSMLSKITSMMRHPSYGIFIPKTPSDDLIENV